jgi:hypothetical protein
MQDEIEEIIEEHNLRVYGGEMPVENKQALRNRIKFLFKRATPDNWAWHTLQNEFGFSPDYCPFDHGMHWSDN